LSIDGKATNDRRKVQVAAKNKTSHWNFTPFARAKAQMAGLATAKVKKAYFGFST
jgi:hypothetical protein